MLVGEGRACTLMLLQATISLCSVASFPYAFMLRGPSRGVHSAPPPPPPQPPRYDHRSRAQDAVAYSTGDHRARNRGFSLSIWGQEAGADARQRAVGKGTEGAVLLTSDHRVKGISVTEAQEHDLEQASALCVDAFFGGLQASTNPLTAVQRTLLTRQQLRDLRSRWCALHAYAGGATGGGAGGGGGGGRRVAGDTGVSAGSSSDPRGGGGAHDDDGGGGGVGVGTGIRDAKGQRRTEEAYTTITAANGSDGSSRVVMLQAVEGATGDMVGFVEVSRIQTTGKVSFSRGEGWRVIRRPKGYIANLSVKPTHRRRGIGRMLTRACESLVTSWGCHEMLLSVDEDNHAARQLYESLGYREFLRKEGGRKYDLLGPFVRSVPVAKLFMRKPLRRQTPVAQMLSYLRRCFLDLREVNR